MKKTYSIIKATGSYIPTRIIKNSYFYNQTFYETDGTKIEKSSKEIVEQFKKITDIEERRYVTDDLLTSDIAFLAAKDALESKEIDKETIDYIIVAHNFGDVSDNNKIVDIVPSLAARVKHKLKIENPFCVAYDLPFGCPGWLQGVIQADYFIKSGDAKRILVIGAETLSRIYDPYDRDCMLYSDGAGAVILEAKESEKPVGILAHKTRSDTLNHAYMLWMDKSYKKDFQNGDLFLKMFGRKLYEYALNHVPQVVQMVIENSKLDISDIKKILIHQANAKMDEAILKRIFRLYKQKNIPENIMPMSIKKLGNNSVATIPILIDLIDNGKLEPHAFNKNDYLAFASVGAGMNINALIYKMP